MEREQLLDGKAQHAQGTSCWILFRGYSSEATGRLDCALCRIVACHSPAGESMLRKFLPLFPACFW